MSIDSAPLSYFNGGYQVPPPHPFVGYYPLRTATMPRLVRDGGGGWKRIDPLELEPGFFSQRHDLRFLKGAVAPLQPDDHITPMRF